MTPCSMVASYHMTSCSKVYSDKLTLVYIVQSNNSGGFRNLERGVQPLAGEAQPKIFGLPCPLPVT